MHEHNSHTCADATLAVLAGGRSERMGVSKAHLQFNGVPILESLHKRLNWPGPTMLVSAPDREKPPGHDLFQSIVTDPVAGEGPLRGVLTALEYTASPLLVVIPVDMPCMTMEILSFLVGVLQLRVGKTMAMFQRGGRLEPLPAAFDVPRARFMVREQLNNGKLSLHGLTRVINTALAQPDPSWPETLWVNLNRPADVEGYLRSNRIGADS